jgi:hypothetical protein
MHDQILRSIYYDISNPASYSSRENLYNAAKKINPSIKLADVDTFLSGQLTYSLHRRVVRKFKRNPVVSSRHLEEGQADLVDIQRYKKDNNGQGFILTVIDTFSRKAYAVPVQSKHADNMCKAFTQLFKVYKPEQLQTDDGNEFTAKKVQQLFKDYMVHWFVAKNERIKCSMVERFQRTLMTRIQKYMTAKGTQSFIALLPQFIATYNKTMHHTIKMSPDDAVNAPEHVVFKNIHGFADERSLLKHMIAKPKLKENDTVRIPTQKGTFQKGYTPNFTDAVYTIDKAIPSLRKPVYRLKTHDNKVIKGNFYPEEVQRINNSDVYRVQILAERKRGNKKEYRVHYVNFPDTEDQWVTEAQLKSLS